MPKDSGPSKPAEAEDPGLEQLKADAQRVYAQQAENNKSLLAEQQRRDQKLAELRDENPAAASRQGGEPVPPTPVPAPTAMRELTVPTRSGQTMPVRDRGKHTTKGRA